MGFEAEFTHNRVGRIYVEVDQMISGALQILSKVSKHGEVSLATAVRMGRPHHGDHLDQYPLALLLEGGYLGVTLNYTPPTGAEEMREYALAKTLHMFTLPKDADGAVRYQGIRSSGSLDAETEHVFLKAKGALYLDEYKQRVWDRLWLFVLGLSTGLLVALVGAWLKGLLKLPL
jgi:hypothetical protein